MSSWSGIRFVGEYVGEAVIVATVPHCAARLLVVVVVVSTSTNSGGTYTVVDAVALVAVVVVALSALRESGLPLTVAIEDDTARTAVMKLDVVHFIINFFCYCFAAAREY